MPRRQTRRPTLRSARDRRAERVEDQGLLDNGARRFLALHGSDPARLEALVRDLRQLRDDADRVAYEEPSPQALSAYRRAARELAEAERALKMASTV
jgi:hypothetical protein